MILVDQPDALMDVPISIELSGFAPSQPVTLTTTQIFPSHSRWQARATFTVDENGRVSVARQAPASGDYEGVAAMGLLWSARVWRPRARRFLKIGFWSSLSSIWMPSGQMARGQS
jgi:hypothetical protein